MIQITKTDDGSRYGRICDVICAWILVLYYPLEFALVFGYASRYSHPGLCLVLGVLMIVLRLVAVPIAIIRVVSCIAKRRISILLICVLFVSITTLPWIFTISREAVQRGRTALRNEAKVEDIATECYSILKTDVRDYDIVLDQDALELKYPALRRLRGEVFAYGDAPSSSWPISLMIQLRPWGHYCFRWDEDIGSWVLEEVGNSTTQRHGSWSTSELEQKMLDKGTVKKTGSR